MIVVWSSLLHIHDFNDHLSIWVIQVIIMINDQSSQTFFMLLALHGFPGEYSQVQEQN